jgi:arylsulfatase
MGRVIDAVKELPDADNTMFIYVAGDNGASAEGGIEGSLCENMFFNGFPEKWQDNLKAIDELGGPKHFNHFPSAWAHAMNTPFQWTKQVASHFGGTRNPMIISWPARIKDKGGLRSQFLHTIDLVPTIYDVCGITAPSVLNGIEQKPIEGVSFAATFADAKAPEVRKTQYFEMFVNRGIYHDGWMASATSFEPWNPNRGAFDPDKQKWELYNVNEDFSQANDLAAKNPEKLRQMQDLWWVEASKYNVLPLDWRGSERFNSEAMGRPSLVRGRKSMMYYPGTIGVPDAASPSMINKSWTITADIELADDKTSGMVVTHGGLEGGYGLYFREGKPTFVYNFLGTERMTFAAKEALPKGKVKLAVEFKYDGGGIGKGGTITMTANGKTIAEGRLEKTIPVQFSLGEGLDIGMDIGSPVDFTYKLPFKFTGKIEKVTVDLK